MAEQIEKAERDFLTFDVKFNGLEELGELIKKAKQKKTQKPNFSAK